MLAAFVGYLLMDSMVSAQEVRNQKLKGEIDELDKQIDTIPKEILEALKDLDWPGNVRELENFIERSVILSEGPELRVPLSELDTRVDVSANDRTLEGLERQHIVSVLRETGGVIAGPQGAAVRLGLKRTTLQSRIVRMGIVREEYQD